jgi:LPXTG-motif cell wall-anchored protein
LFGMNIALPFAEHPALFFAVLGLGLALMAGLLIYFRSRNWM